jgi:hypothetical protein
VIFISQDLFQISYPKLQSCRRFGPPREIHDRICHLLSVKNAGLSQVLDFTDKLFLYYTSHLSFTYREALLGPAQPAKWLVSSQRLHSTGSAAILRTCRRVAEEGCRDCVARAPPIVSRATIFIEFSCQKQVRGTAPTFHSIHLWLGAFPNSSCMIALHCCLAS